MKRKKITICAVLSLVIMMGITAVICLKQYNDRMPNSDVVIDDTSELKEDGFVVGNDGISKDEFSVLYSETNYSSDVLLQAIENSKKELNDDGVVGEKKTYDDRDVETIPFDILYPEEFNSGEIEYSANSLLIKFKSFSDSDLNTKLKNIGIGKLEHMFSGNDYTWYTAYIVKDADINDVMENVRRLDNVIVAEYNYKYEITADMSEIEYVSENEKVNDQWYLWECGIPQMWDFLYDHNLNPGGKNSITVAVIDTGVDYNHNDLRNNIWVNNYEVLNNGIDDDNNGYVDDYYGVDITAVSSVGGSGMDDNGHGTHVAGIIAAENNDYGVVGIAYNTKIIPIKAGDASGAFLQSNIAKAIIYAYDNGADVINMSFGGSASSIAVQDALETAYLSCVLIASAGNTGFPNENTDYYYGSPTYPADFSYVLGIMSCDKNKKESSFSNWDAYLYNMDEYEVYAPGEAIMSTLPGNRYGFLSGTSMAAPVVSAQAALLRSFYSDRDTYPTKFIYGQITGTADQIVSCCFPEKHTVNGSLHNVPGLVNFYNSISELPKPDIGISDYTIFDAAGSNYDLNSKNNGDGIIDAGETIALGFTLKNRWGMSKNTVVHIDSISDLEVENPYVSFVNNDLEYGSIGTYSENDSGKIYDGDKWIGWENPFYVSISDDCPNNYTIKINISVTYENGLDDNDETPYESDDYSILFSVRRGVVLRNITEDTTLTSEYYYIIPNTLLITEGSTLTIERGTKVQFWCSDPNDAYADSGVAEIKVNGRLICNGTEDEPVELFPSDWKDRNVVKIYTSGKGYVSLNYTNVTNPFLTINEANNCEFNQTLSRLDVSNLRLTINNAQYSSFYKLNGYTLKGDNFSGCAFIDSNIRHEASNYNNCVFYGNNSFEQGKYSQTEGGVSSLSSMEYYNNAISLEALGIKSNSETSRSYFYTKLIGDGENGQVAHLIPAVQQLYHFADTKGIEISTFETEEEYQYVSRNMVSDGTDRRFLINKNITDQNWDYSKYNRTSYNGNTIYTFMNSSGFYLYSDSDALGNYGYKGAIFEMPSRLFILNIMFDKQIIDLDLDSTHQISARVSPSTLSDEKLNYISLNENIATVDENGLITPVSKGTTQIKVSSPDHGVYNYLTVNIIEKIDVEKIYISNVDNNELYINVGESKQLIVGYYPSNTTDKELSFFSSNNNVVSVDDKGLVTSKTVGEAVLTVTGQNQTSTTVNVHSDNQVKSISFKNSSYTTNLSSDGYEEKDAAALMLEIDPEDAINATNKERIVWESSNPDVCDIDENGTLVKYTNGSASIKASVKGTSVSDTIQIIVDESYVPTNIIKVASINRRSNNNYTRIFALTESGNLYMWGGSNYYSPKLKATDVVDILADEYNSYLYILYEDGTIKRFSSTQYESFIDINLSNISRFSDYCYGGAFFAIDDDGSVWAWGNNDFGQLGTGDTTGTTTPGGEIIPVQIDFDSKVTKIISSGGSYNNVNYGLTYFLDEYGNVYAAGGNDHYLNPTLIQTDVLDIYPYRRYASTTSSSYEFGLGIDKGDILITSEQTSIEKDRKSKYFDRRMYYIENGKMYVKAIEDYSSTTFYGSFGYGATNRSELRIGEYVPVDNINDAKEAIFFYNDWLTFIITESGNLYGTGSGKNYGLGINSTSTVYSPIRIDLDSVSYSGQINRLKTNIVEGVFTGNSIKVSYDVAIVPGEYNSGIALKDSSGSLVGMKKEIDFNSLVITPKTELIEGEIYTLIIPLQAFRNERGDLYNQREELSFEYHRPTISFAQSVYAVEKDEVLSINPIVNCSDDYEIEWTSDDQDIASYNNNQIMGVDNGVVRMTATIKGTGASATTYINVGNQELSNIGSTINNETVNDVQIIYTFNMPVIEGENYSEINIMEIVDNNENIPVEINKTIVKNRLIIYSTSGFKAEKQYFVNIPEGALTNVIGNVYDGRSDEFHLGDVRVSIESNNLDNRILYDDYLELRTNMLLENINSESIKLKKSGESAGISISVSSSLDKFTVSSNEGFVNNQAYNLIIEEGALVSMTGRTNEIIEIPFIYEDLNMQTSAMIDEEIVNSRDYLTVEYIEDLWDAYIDSNVNYRFYSNAILNRLSDDDTRTWLRITGGNMPSDKDYYSVPLGENYWGTTDIDLINKQILDFDDYQTMIDLDETGFFSEAPENTYPFVVRAYLTVEGEEQTTVGNETVTFVVEFNRAMDREKNVEVAFGSSYPYREYEVEGAFVSDTRWEGTVTLKTLIENGYQYFSVSKGRTVEDEKGNHLKLYEDWGRFPFKIDTSSALSLTMFATPKDDCIELSWEQDDFDTLAGYNVYRSTLEDGLYTKLNTTVIPYDVKEWNDRTVEPGVRYYYNFTVVDTDFNESEPSGKVSVVSNDTMAPDIYHTPVSLAYTGSNLVISATIVDNVGVESATLYYRTIGEEEWKSCTMSKNNDRYSGLIYSDDITTAGIQYYICASDGETSKYKGSSDDPFEITVQNAIPASSKGDVDGNGRVELKDAMMLLMAKNDKLNLTSDEFFRADLNGDGELSAAEALRIIKYVNGSVSSLIS